MPTPTPTPTPEKTTAITCMSDCGYSGRLVYPTLWIWPVIGIVLALALLALHRLRNRNHSFKSKSIDYPQKMCHLWPHA